MRSTTSARCASWSTTSRTATRRSASCTTSGRRCAQRVRRLHRQAEGQRLPLAAHRRHRPRGQAARSADPHPRHAPAFGIRRRRALALQGRRAAARRDPGYDEKIAWLRQVLDWKDAVADAGEWLQQFKSSLFTDTDLRADAAGQGGRSAARRDAGRFRLRRAYEPRPPLPRRARRRRDGAAELSRSRADSGSRSSRLSRAGPRRPKSRLAQPGARLRGEPPRAHQGAAMVQGAAARGDDRARARDRRARAARARGLPRSSSKRLPPRPAIAKLDDFFAAVARDRNQPARVADARSMRSASPALLRRRPRPKQKPSSPARARRRVPAAASSSSASIA